MTKKDVMELFEPTPIEIWAAVETAYPKSISGYVRPRNGRLVVQLDDGTIGPSDRLAEQALISAMVQSAKLIRLDGAWKAPGQIACDDDELGGTLFSCFRAWQMR